MTNPKGKKPASDHPQGDDLSLPPPSDEHSLDSLALNASTEEFHFSGPAEELDFTEPSDFAFPTGQASGVASAQSGEFAAAEPAEAGQFFGAMDTSAAESSLPEAISADTELAGEGIADLEIAEEPVDGEEKPKRELPAWVRIAEWVTVGVLGAAALLAVVSCIWLEDAKLVSLILNIACPLMLALIPYSLWRSSTRWVTPAASAPYTVMLALSAAALIVGTWLLGLELARDAAHHGYDWQFSKARVAAGKPRPAIIAPSPQPAPARELEPVAPAPAAPAPVPAATAKPSAVAAPAPATPAPDAAAKPSAAAAPAK